MTNRSKVPIDASPELTIDDLDPTGTLFELTSEKEPASTAPVVVYGGVVVGLVERLEALEAISKLYGVRNRARGLNQAMNIKPYRDKLRSQYPDPSHIADMASAKAAEQTHELEEHFQTLEATKELQEAGFGYDKSVIAAGMTRQSVMDAFGDGSDYKTRQSNLRGPRRSLKAVQKTTQNKV